MPKLKLTKLDNETLLNEDTGELQNVAPKEEESQPEPAKGNGQPKKERRSPIEKIKEYLNERYSFRFNTIKQSNEFFPTYDSTQEDYEPLDERSKNDIILDIMDSGEVSNRGLMSLFDLIIKSSFIPDYNPIESYFRSLKWDGKPRIRALQDTMDIENLPIEYEYQGKLYQTTTLDLWREYFPRWLMSCIHCGLGRGANQVMLMFQGGQGKGKSHWLDHLCPPDLREYSITGHIIPDATNRETANILAERFWSNIDDQMEKIFAKDAQSIKGIISKPTVSVRKLHTNDTPKRLRIVNFVGSVNPRNIFTDIENRRYLIFALNSGDDPINHEAFNAIDINQIWAEIWTRYKTGESFFFGKKEFAAINAMNVHFVQASQEEEMLIKYFRPATPEELEADKSPSFHSNQPNTVRYLQKTEILAQLTRDSGLRLFSRALNMAMEKHGFYTISKRIGGSPRYVVPVVNVD